MAGPVMVASVPHRKVPFVLCVFSAVFFPPLGRLTLDEAALFHVYLRIQVGCERLIRSDWQSR
jgi:hypothetical protein